MDPFFKNPEVAAAYQIAPGFEADRTVTVIGMFSGPLSNISLPAADRAFAQGTNLFVKKTPAPNHGLALRGLLAGWPRLTPLCTNTPLRGNW